MGYDGVTGINFPLMQRELTSYFGDPRDDSFADEYLTVIDLSMYGLSQFTKVYGNWIMERPLRLALDGLQSIGMLGVIDTYDGCFNIRPMKASNSTLSVHAWGLALDLNASTNPYGKKLVTDFPDEFIRCFAMAGFEWGGLWNSVKDAMHFQLPWTRDWRIVQHPLKPLVFGE